MSRKFVHTMQNTYPLLYADQTPHLTNYHETAHYARGVYDLGQHLYTYLSPNGSWNETNTGLIAGKSESLLVDTLIDLPHTQTMLDLMRPLTSPCPIRYIVNTHADWDHCWGNQLLTQAEIISSQACYEEMQHLTPGAYMSLNTLGSLLKLAGLLPGLTKYRTIGTWWQRWLAPYNPRSVKITLPSRHFTDTLILLVGGREVQLLEVGPMHTQGDILVYVPDARTLYAGDTLFVGVTPVLWVGPLEHWIAALDKILRMDVECIVPGHGAITDKDGVQQLRNYWTFLGTEARRCYSARISAQQAAYEIARSTEFINSPFARWDSPERMLVSIYTLYRWFQGRTEHIKLFERLRILAQQAEFAMTFPAATPKRLHLEGLNSSFRAI
jgi:cyclase